MLNTDYTITIIEDDPLQLENLETALTEQGFQVKAFTERKPAEASFDEALPAWSFPTSFSVMKSTAVLNWPSTCCLTKEPFR